MAEQLGEDSTSRDASVHWFMAALLGGAAMAIPWYFQLAWNFDPDSLDFNPIVLVPMVLGVVALYQAGLGVIGTMRRRRFGTSVLDLKGAGVGRLGQPLRGTIRTSTLLHPTGDYRLALQCLDTHAFRSSSSDSVSKEREFVVWEQVVTVPATGIDATKGIPFTFQLPDSVGPDVDADGGEEPERSSGPSFHYRMAINIPGMRRKVMTNEAPKARRWQIDVSAPMPGTDFRAQFPVTVQRAAMNVRVLSSGLLILVVSLAACSGTPPVEPADTLLINGRIYTFAWDEPAPDGTPAASAPHTAEGWRPDAEAVAVRGGRIVFVGTSKDAEAYRGPSTRVVDLAGATAIPGLVDSHAHIFELGQMETYLDLTGVATEAEAVDRVVAFAAKVPTGEWIVGRGWDEGAWASRYPTMALLSERVPDHPVVLASLHGFGVWGNRLAFEKAKITRATAAPTGGVILKDAKGEPTGTLLNRATTLLQAAIPPPTPEQAKAWVLAGLTRMARDGYVAIHEAGADARMMQAVESLRAGGQLPTRVYAMLSAREPDLCRAWLTKGPLVDPEGMLTVRSVKAYYDGSLGSRGARLIEDYADQKGHRGVSGGSYGFDQAIVAEMMKAGFQVGIHAIGDAGNRETLDFIEAVEREKADVRNNRNRIEHAQVVHPDDFARFASHQVIASMEPPHAVEDKAWAEDRLGAERVKGAYAWRTFRQSRRAPHLQLRPDRLGPQHLLRPALGHHAPGQDPAAGGRLVSGAADDP